MSEEVQVVIDADGLPDEAPQQLAMIYRNEFNEVAVVSSVSDELSVETGFTGLVLVLVLSLLALVTISRRPTK